MKKLTSLSYPVLILLLGALARIWGINASAIWYDEAITVNLARLPLRQFFAQQWLEYSPPLWNLLMRPFVHGPLWLVRLPAMLASLASLYVVYLLMQRLEFSEWQKNLTAALVAFFPALLWTAQDARGYALLSLLYLLAFLFALDAKWTWLGVVSVLMLYAHNVAPFLLIAIYLIALSQHKSEWRKMLITGGAALLAFAPWMPAIFRQSDSFWMNAFDSAWAINQLVFSFWVNTLDGLSTLLFLLLFLSVPFMARKNKKLALLYALPFLGMLLFSIFAINILFYRPLILLLIPFALWIGASLPEKMWAKTLVTFGWVALLLAGFANWTPTTKGAGLDSAAAYIAQHWQCGDLIYYTTGTAALPFDYYLHDKPHLLMDTEQHPGLMQLSHARAFGIPMGTLTPDNLGKRTWVIYPQDVLLDETTIESLSWVEEHGQLVGFLDYAQAADIEIWLVGEER